MKLKLLLLFCFLSVAMSAQITDLGKLSKGRYYSSDVIKDINNNIRGYFILFESDKIAKETYELEYVVLDENLKKVTNGFITEMKFESWLINAQNINVKTTLYNNKLLLEFADNVNGQLAYQRYRILDIATNKLSETFIFNKDEMKLNPNLDRKMKGFSNSISEKMDFYEGVGLVVNALSIDKKENRNWEYLAHYDSNFKQVWKYEYENHEDKNRKKGMDLSYVKSDGDVIVLFNHFSKKNGIWLNDFSVIFLDAKTGKVRSEFQFPNVDKNAYKIVDCKISADKVYLLGNYSKDSEYGNINDVDNTGLFKFTFNKSDAKLVDSKFLAWESINPTLPISSKGYVKKEGYMFVHNILPLDKGGYVAVTETFIQSPITTNNMYFFELSDDLSVKQVFEVTKFRNKFPETLAHSNNIKKYGLFDFIDYQTMGDDEFLFFLNDNEKKSKNRRKSTLYGIVSYADGKFVRQTLDLKTETSRIYAMNAKKGYLTLIENFDESGKETEIRLEKINY